MHFSLNVSRQYTWAMSCKNVSSRIFDQIRFKSVCSATEASQNLETLDIPSIHIILSTQRTTKVLIRLRGCAGWSAPLLFAYDIRHIFAWPGSYNIMHFSLNVSIQYIWKLCHGKCYHHVWNNTKLFFIDTQLSLACNNFKLVENELYVKKQEAVFTLFH